MSSKGIIFDIQKFCLHDGPGIRTTIFFKGCQMRCVWCHNPESILRQPQLAFMENKCVNCQRCAAVCPHDCHHFLNGKHKVDFDACQACGLCVEQCVPQALKIYGREYDTDELIGDVIKDMPYFSKTGGGLTLSGGEAMFQFPFALALVKAAKKAEIHVCIETNGASRPERYREIAPWVDIFLLDYKVTQPQQHKEFTGLGKTVINKTLATLAEIDAKVILRCPLIPGYNVNDTHFSAIRDIAAHYDNILHVEILPWHNLGVTKCRELGVEAICQQPMPKDSEVDSWLERLNIDGGKAVKRA